MAPINWCLTLLGMTRRRRIFVPGYPLHVVQRGNDRRAIFLDDHDRARYLDFLIEAAEQHECAIHCYVLMGNHVHLLMTPATAKSLAATMQSVGIRYVHYFNTTHERTGGLWEGRYRDWFRTSPTEDELNDIRETTRQELVFGDDAFKDQLEARQFGPVRPARRGRKRIGV